MQSNRRVFMMQLATATGALALASQAQAQAQAMLDEASSQAAALNYKADATKVSHAKYAKGQNCSNCALYQGAAGSKAGGCPLFAGKQVAAGGWCSAYAKKG
jgi:High potential iron-sulfur protein